MRPSLRWGDSRWVRSRPGSSGTGGLGRKVTRTQLPRCSPTTRFIARARSASRTSGTQTGTSVQIGRPVVEGDRLAVEWWATYTDAEEGEGTLPGILMLRFAPDGRCAELRETWIWEAGIRDPHPGWGT
jgi:hypothetical protein